MPSIKIKDTDQFDIGLRKFKRACEKAIFDFAEQSNFIVIGDVNEDSLVNIQDIVVIVSIVLDGQPTGELLALADLNQDGTVDILDIIVLVNIILS